MNGPSSCPSPATAITVTAGALQAPSAPGGSPRPIDTHNRILDAAATPQVTLETRSAQASEPQASSLRTSIEHSQNQVFNLTSEQRANIADIQKPYRSHGTETINITNSAQRTDIDFFNKIGINLILEPKTFGETEAVEVEVAPLLKCRAIIEAHELDPDYHINCTGTYLVTSARASDKPVTILLQSNIAGGIEGQKLSLLTLSDSKPKTLPIESVDKCCIKSSMHLSTSPTQLVVVYKNEKIPKSYHLNSGHLSTEQRKIISNIQNGLYKITDNAVEHILPDTKRIGISGLSIQLETDTFATSQSVDVDMASSEKDGENILKAHGLPASDYECLSSAYIVTSAKHSNKPATVLVAPNRRRAPTTDAFLLALSSDGVPLECPSEIIEDETGLAVHGVCKTAMHLETDPVKLVLIRKKEH